MGLKNLFDQGKYFSIQIPLKGQGRRIDQFLSETNLHLSRSRAKKLIEEGAILLNNQKTKPSVHIKSGDLISGALPEPEPLSLEPEPLPLPILYEDHSIIVIDKPAGMVVHPAAGNPSGTLVNALLYHCKDLSGINGALRPGIVHRLDKETSGVMVVAKDDEAYHQLTRQFKNRRVEKVYLAIAYGNIKESEGLIDAPIGRHPDQRKKMSIRTTRGRAALTHWKVLERFGSFTFLEIYPKTGRTHQIRVHLSSMGHPILGDPLYGRKGKPGMINDPLLGKCVNPVRNSSGALNPAGIILKPNPAAKQRGIISNGVKGINRQALHAHRLRFNHPRTGEKVQFVAPIPQDMKETLECLRSMV